VEKRRTDQESGRFQREGKTGRPRQQPRERGKGLLSSREGTQGREDPYYRVDDPGERGRCGIAAPDQGGSGLLPTRDEIGSKKD